jgi:hypothetical protein
MASDSRISDARGAVIDEGIKLYEVPVACRRGRPKRILRHSVLHDRYREVGAADRWCISTYMGRSCRFSAI